MLAYSAATALSTPFISRAWAAPGEINMLAWYGHGAPDVVAEVGHLHTLVSLVAAGMGIAVGVSSLMNFQPPGVVFKEFADNLSELYVEFGLAWRGDDDGPLLASFLNTARQFQEKTGSNHPRFG